MKSLKYIFLLLALIYFAGCSGSKKFTSEDSRVDNIHKNSYNQNSLNKIHVFLGDSDFSVEYTAEEPVNLVLDERITKNLMAGNKVKFIPNGDKIDALIEGKNYSLKKIELFPEKNRHVFIYHQKRYRGKLNLTSVRNKILIINTLDLQEYLKGVISKEMPVGKDEENYEALKAFAICARTYAIMKINESNNLFDVYPDVRDQVYGGVEAETTISNQAVDETEGKILSYNNMPAKTFYHAACGGYTEAGSECF